MDFVGVLWFCRYEEIAVPKHREADRQLLASPRLVVRDVGHNGQGAPEDATDSLQYLE